MTNCNRVVEEKRSFCNYNHEIPKDNVIHPIISIVISQPERLVSMRRNTQHLRRPHIPESTLFVRFEASLNALRVFSLPLRFSSAA